MQDAGHMLQEVATAAEGLNSAADVLTSTGGQILPAEAVEIESLFARLASMLAQSQQWEAHAFADAAHQAMAAGKVRAAASSALQAKECAAIGMWAAVMAGIRAVQELGSGLDAAMRAADAAVQLLAAAADSTAETADRGVLDLGQRPPDDEPTPATAAGCEATAAAAEGSGHSIAMAASAARGGGSADVGRSSEDAEASNNVAYSERNRRSLVPARVDEPSISRAAGQSPAATLTSTECLTATEITPAAGVHPHTVGISEEGMVTAAAAAAAPLPQPVELAVEAGPKTPGEADVVARLYEILRNADLSVINLRKIRTQLQADLGCDMAPYTEIIERYFYQAAPGAGAPAVSIAAAEAGDGPAVQDEAFRPALATAVAGAAGVSAEVIPASETDSSETADKEAPQTGGMGAAADATLPAFDTLVGPMGFVAVSAGASGHAAVAPVDAPLDLLSPNQKGALASGGNWHGPSEIRALSGPGRQSQAALPATTHTAQEPASSLPACEWVLDGLLDTDAPRSPRRGVGSCSTSSSSRCSSSTSSRGSISGQEVGLRGEQGGIGRGGDTPGEPSVVCEPGHAFAGGRDLHSVIDYLEQAAGMVKAGGQLPEDCLRNVGAAFHALRKDLTITAATGSGASPMVLWADPVLLGAVFINLSYAIRQIQASVNAVSPTTMTETLSSMIDRFAGLIMTLLDFLKRVDPPESPTVRVEVLRLLVHTQVVQCLSGALAGVAAAALGLIREQQGPPPSSGHGDEPVCTAAPPSTTEANPADSPHNSYPCSHILENAPVVDMLAALLALLHCLVCICMRSELRGVAGPLQGAILTSKALEHAARAVVLTWHTVSGLARPIASKARDRYLMLLKTMQHLLLIRGFSSRPLAVWADVLLSGPCVQHLLLLHAVSQLCIADGGSDYGLPVGVRMPPVAASIPGAQAPATTQVQNHSGDFTPAAQPTARESAARCALSADMMITTFLWWAHNRARPCSYRALRTVCERAVAASWACCAAAELAPAGGSEEARPAWSSFHRNHAVSLALTAMECAVSLTRKGAAGDFGPLWVPVVETANMALQISPSIGYPSIEYLSRLNPQPCPLRLLASMLPLPSLLSQPKGDDGDIAASPGPELTAVLKAGYISCLQRCLSSRASTAMTERSKPTASVLQVLLLLLEDCQGLSSLLVYGDLTDAAALVTTLTRAANVAFDALLEKKSGDWQCSAIGALHRGISTMCNFLAMSTKRECNSRHVFWWQRHCSSIGSGSRDQNDLASSGSGGGSAARASAAIEAVDQGGTDTEGEGGDAGSEGLDKGPRRLSPPHQLSVLTAFSLTRWMALTRKLLERCSAAKPNHQSPCAEVAMVASNIASNMSAALLLAYLHCRVKAQTATEEPSPRTAAARGARCSTSSTYNRGAAPTVASGSAPMGGATESTDYAVAAASWEALLLGPLDLPGLVAVQFRVAAAYGLADRHDELLLLLGWSLRNMLATFPRQTRSLLRVPVTPSSTLIAWLQDAVSRRGRPSDITQLQSTIAMALAALAGKGTQAAVDSDIQFLSTALITSDSMGPLLPPPCVVEGALRLAPLCANPVCTNQEGDSGTGRRPTVAAADRSLDAVLMYCSESCKQQHKRAKQRS